MSEYTSEENQELVETLKGKRYYRLYLNGYGGEGAYMSITKEAHDFWKEVTEGNGDSDLVSYMVGSEDEEFDFENIEDVPEEAKFLTDDEGDPRPWYEAPTEYEHSYGATYDAAWLTVEEVESDDYNASVIREVVDRQDLPEFISNLQEETNYEFEGTDFIECYAGNDVEYIAQMYSSEKGCFFDGLIVTYGDFDPKKLKVIYTEYPNGEDVVSVIEYDGQNIDNNGGDTNGKGYSAHLWKNVQ